MSKRGDITFTVAMVADHARKHGLAMPEGLITGAASPVVTSKAPKRRIAAQEQSGGVAKILQKGGKPCATLNAVAAAMGKASLVPSTASMFVASNAAPTSYPEAWPIVITLPIPDRKLSPNARCHWAEKAKLTKAHRTRAMLLALATLPATRQPKWEKATVQVQWFSRTAKVQDEDNLIATLKHVGDALQDTQIVTNDRGLTWLPPIQSKDARNPRVVLTVTLLP